MLGTFAANPYFAEIGKVDSKALTNWQHYDIILLSVSSNRTGGGKRQNIRISEKEHEMIGGSLMTIEAIRDQRFPEIRLGEERNPPIRGTRVNGRSGTSPVGTGPLGIGS